MTNSVMIATPMYGGLCTGQYVRGVLMTTSVLRERGVSVFWCNTMNESLITRARNELVRLFMESDCTHLLFIDADIAFEPDGVLALLEADVDVACGIYPKKEINWSGIEVAARAGAYPLRDHAGVFVCNMARASEQTDERGLIEIRHGGTGFMMIRREVFETLAAVVPTYRVSSYRDPDTGDHIKPLTCEFFATSIDHTGALLSEDYHFCELWRKHGGRVHANPFIKLEHVGTHVFGGDITKGIIG